MIEQNGIMTTSPTGNSAKLSGLKLLQLKGVVIGCHKAFYNVIKNSSGWAMFIKVMQNKKAYAIIVTQIKQSNCSVQGEHQNQTWWDLSAPKGSRQD